MMCMDWFLVRLMRVVKFIFLSVLLCSCSKPDEGLGIVEGAFGEMGTPVSFASEDQLLAFERGKQMMQHRFSEEEGLGPHFNVTFCGGCHEKPTMGGSAGRYRDFLLVSQKLEDGSSVPTSVNGIQPQFHTKWVRHPTDLSTNHFANRNPIPFFGVGLLAEISEEEILSREDPKDLDGDGIRGRPNFDRGFVGRFGRKAQTVSLEGFVRGPLFNHLGITSFPLSEEMKLKLPIPSQTAVRFSWKDQIEDWFLPAVFAQAAAPEEPTLDEDDAQDPELSESALFDLVSFVMLLAAPDPEPLNEDTRAGRSTFENIRCSSCHVPELRGPRGMVPAYTDLLLHDMGDGLDDGVVMGVATGRDFRTAPLWGVVATSPYLHDGRADTIEQAILFHDGEARSSREDFEVLSRVERDQVIAFLESLGGRTQKSEGLLLPGARIPNGLGGPVQGLNHQQLDVFERGRALFDRDVFLKDGLGISFNGDSCRACHFEPLIGGAGPRGVNVIRYGFFDPAINFEPPMSGTVAHRHSTLAVREMLETQEGKMQVFETRQTPALFGLGRIEQILEDEIVANADPEDDDGDGIRGIVHRLEDGRLGRFGWKASIPSVAEFVRDALSTEMGLTMDLPPMAVPPMVGFGLSEDVDGTVDPEFLDENLTALTFFTAQLAPPVASTHDEAFQEGLLVFEEVGCASCHVPYLRDDNDAEVWLFSDLLLHDVAAVDYLGVAEANATHREFRTPPLWGISQTAPYMHDGSASNLEAAIEEHHEEAESAKQRFQNLTQEHKDSLLHWLKLL